MALVSCDTSPPADSGSPKSVADPIGVENGVSTRGSSRIGFFSLARLDRSGVISSDCVGEMSPDLLMEREPGAEGVT